MISVVPWTIGDRSTFVRFWIEIGEGLEWNAVHMARERRVEGGLYHLITRGVDRRDIFHDEPDHAKFLAFLAVQKESLVDNLESQYGTGSGLRICDFW